MFISLIFFSFVSLTVAKRKSLETDSDYEPKDKPPAKKMRRKAGWLFFLSVFLGEGLRCWGGKGKRRGERGLEGMICVFGTFFLYNFSLMHTHRVQNKNTIFRPRSGSKRCSATPSLFPSLPEIRCQSVQHLFLLVGTSICFLSIDLGVFPSFWYRQKAS